MACQIKPGTKEWTAMNKQRARLVYKEYEEGLTPDETELLDNLQRISREAIEGTEEDEE